MGSQTRQLTRHPQSLRCMSLLLPPQRWLTRAVKNPHWLQPPSQIPFPGSGLRVWMLFRHWPAPVSPESRYKGRKLGWVVLSSMVPTMWNPRRYSLSQLPRDGKRTDLLPNKRAPLVERKTTKLGHIAIPRKRRQTVRMTSRTMNSSSLTKTGAPK